LKEYSGAVFFVDILGVGALTQGEINITKEDFLSHRFSFKENFSEHQFCAKLLVKFRRILTNATENVKKIKVAQLSDCAFIWSEDPDLVVNVARDIMWKSTLGGILCRGGLAYGQIVEPDKINTKLGMFICGGAVTDAVKLEETGKGARVFINTELVSELKSIPSTAFVPRKNPINFTIADEFLWYKYPELIESTYDDVKVDRLKVLDGIAKAIAMLKHSPRFSWNSLSAPGRLQLASTIDVVSSETENLANNLDLKFECEYVINSLENRSEQRHKKALNVYRQTIGQEVKTNKTFKRN